MQKTKFEYIKEKLIYIDSKVTIDKSFNLQDINIGAEDMFMHILNDVYDYKLINANKIKDNFPTVDLIDEKNRIVVQVTSSIGTEKINHTLKGIEKFKDNDDFKKYSDYKLLFLYIIEEKKALSDKFKKDRGLTDKNFCDITDILKKIQGNLDIEEKVYSTLERIFVPNDKTIINKVIENQKNEEYIIHKDDYIEPKTVFIKELNLHVAVCHITFEEYDLFCSYNPIFSNPDSFKFKQERGLSPIVNIKWSEANSYCEWLSGIIEKVYRLPTVKEWMYIVDNYKKEFNDISSNLKIWCVDDDGEGCKAIVSDKKIEDYLLPYDSNDYLSFRIVCE